MLARAPERRRRHDVGGRIHSVAARHYRVEDARVSLEVERPPRGPAQLHIELLPGLDAVEELEEQSAEEDLLAGLLASVEDVADQVLTDSVSCTRSEEHTSELQS